jgi:2Fe-2S ferredoxin
LQRWRIGGMYAADRSKVMPQLRVVTRDGEERTVTGTPGLSVMEVIREGGIDEILAICGGCCSCATCHVHVDPEHAAKLPPMSEDENDLLDSVPDRDERSRLSCQIAFTPELDAMRVTIGEED